MSGLRPFFTDGPATDPLYRCYRDRPHCRPIRELIERLWAGYEPYCPDENFLSDARAHFVQRTWQVYLACVLLRAGLPMKKPPSRGPDIKLATRPTVWVEAVAPEAGSGADAVPARSERVVYTGGGQGRPAIYHGPGEEPLILRCTSALIDKTKMRDEYLADGVVAPDEPFVIGISLAAVEDSDIPSPDIPLIIKAVLAVGAAQLAVKLNSNEEPKFGYGHRPTITKRSKAQVKATFFMQEASAGVSGVFFTTSGIWHAAEPIGMDLCFVHNPMASAPVSFGTFRFGREYWVEKNQVRDADWRPAQQLSARWVLLVARSYVRNLLRSFWPLRFSAGAS